MKKVCEHFLALKPEKVANFLKKTQVRCAFQKHISLEYNLCLHCGETRCDTSSQNFCSQQHSQTNKHYVVLKIIAMQVYCFHCEKYIDDIIVDAESSGNENKKTEKTVEFRDKILGLAQKYLASSKQEKKKKQSFKKIEHQTLAQEPMMMREGKIKKQMSLRVFGLTNIGNTCYFNSVLQCLYATQQLHQLYQEVEFKDEVNLVFRKFLRNTEKVHCPKNLFSLISKSHKFLRGMDQQDAFELYVLLLNSLIQSSEKKHQNKNHPNISNIFGFTLASRLQCLNCGKISWNKDFSLGLNVPISKKTGLKKIDHIPSNQEISVEQIGEEGLFIPPFEQSNSFLDHFFDPELFTKNNSFKCQECKESNAVHKFYIKEAPPVLTINFKRFNNSGMKLNSKVNIPKEISLSNVLLKKGNYKYQIYAGVVHSGSSSGGHYVAYTKRNDQWIYFSDSHCKPGGSFKTTQPYVVFYKRVECEEDRKFEQKEKIGNQKKHKEEKEEKKQNLEKDSSQSPRSEKQQEDRQQENNQ